MRLYYIGGSEGPRHYVRSALGVDAERWNELFRDLHSWRLDLRDRYGIPLCLELHASDLLAGWGMHARIGDTAERLTRQQGAEVFLSGLRRLEDAARSMGGIEVINVCLDKAESRRYEQVSLDRLLNRINTSVASVGRHAFLIFGEGKEEMIARDLPEAQGSQPCAEQVREVGGRGRRPGTSLWRRSSEALCSATLTATTCSRWRTSWPTRC